MSDNKERVAKLLGDGLEEIIDLVKSSKALAKEQLPEVAREIITLDTLYCILGLVVGSLLLVAGVIALVLLPTEAKPISIFPLGSGGAILVGSTVTLLKVKYAPKLYLIEKLKYLIK